MSQAEIAGGMVTPKGEIPSKGHLLRDFALTSASGCTIHLSDYRGRANLVLILDDGRPETARLMSDAVSRYSEIKNEAAEVLAIIRASPDVQATQQSNLPYPVLLDETGSTLRELGAADSQGRDSAAVYIADRFGEVFGAYRREAGQSVPEITEILKWLEFINAQCPECEPPEWPV